MSVRVISITNCDRCKEDFNPCGGFGHHTIKDLSYMVLNNGGGSQNSNMSLDLCEDCTDLFLDFMGDKR